MLQLPERVVSDPAAAVAAGPADMGFSFGLHVQQDYDLPAMMASPDMQQIYGTVLEVWAAAAVQSIVCCMCCDSPVASNRSTCLQTAHCMICAGRRARSPHSLSADSCLLTSTLPHTLPCTARAALLPQACRKHGVQPGVFCLGEERAAELASMGYTNIAFNTDLSVLVNYTVSSMNKLKSSNFSI